MKLLISAILATAFMIAPAAAACKTNFQFGVCKFTPSKGNAKADENGTRTRPVERPAVPAPVSK